MRDPNFVYLGPKPIPGTHVADGIVPIAPSPEQHPAEQQFRVLSDLARVGRVIGRILAFIAVPIGVLLLIAAAMAISGCSRPAESVSSTTNSAFQVERLFKHDGCTVYRFSDYQTPHYFVRCDAGPDRVEWQESCGKHCTRPVEIDTSRGSGR